MKSESCHECGPLADGWTLEAHRAMEHFTKGRKDDQEKLRFDLIPAEVETALAAVLTHGAKKYTTYGECKCRALVEQVLMQEENVCPVMNEIYAKLTLNTPSGNESTQESGPNVTPNESSSTIKSEFYKTEPTPSTVDENPPIATDFPSTSTKISSQDPVVSAVRSSGLDISTIRMRQEKLEGLSVTDAILASDTWKSGGKLGAEQHLDGCLALKIVRTGDRNWEKGIDWMRCYGAVRRHLNAWLRGEDIDEESGLPAIDLALCEIVFLSTFYHRKSGHDFDNRPL